MKSHGLDEKPGARSAEAPLPCRLPRKRKRNRQSFWPPTRRLPVPDLSLQGRERLPSRRSRPSSPARPSCPHGMPLHHLLGAGAPEELEVLRELERGIVVGELAAGVLVGRGERQAVVDVEDALGAARRPDVAGGGDLVDLGVDLAVSPDSAARDGRLRGGGGRSILAEVVGAEEGARDALVELRVAVVRALDSGELEARGVLPAVGVSIRLLAKSGTRRRSPHTLRVRWIWQFLVRSEAFAPGPM